MPAPIAAAAAASAAGGAAAGGTAAAAGGTAAAAGAAGGAAAGGTAAAGASGTAGATAARAGSGALKGAGRKAVSGGKNIASKAKGAYDKLPTGVQKGLKRGVRNYAQNKIEDKYQEHQEEKAMKGINPVREDGEEEYQNDKQDLKKGCLIGFGGLVGCGCLTSIFVPVFLGALVFLMPYAVVSWLSSVVEVDFEKVSTSTLASCEGCTYDELNAIREHQWKEKIEKLSDEYGSKIDKAALIATATYNQNLSDVMAAEYTDTNNFNPDDWFGNMVAGTFTNLWNSTNGDAGQNFGQYSSNNISLLQYIAEGMASSGDTYSDDKYKEWLINGGKNPLYCAASKPLNDVRTFFSRVASNMGVATDRFFTELDKGRIPFEYFTPKVAGDVVISSTVGSTAYYWNDGFNYLRICNYGYIEGMIPGVYNIENDKSKKIKKEQIAQEIIDLAEYYRESDEWENAATSSDAKGSICYYKVPGIDEEVSNVKVQTLRCEYGNDSGSVGDPITGEGLVDFESEYIPGVVYGEVGSESSDDTQKAQAVYARSFALNRGNAMNGAYGIGLSIENGQWVLKLRNCTSDQAYCNIDKGCGTLDGGTPQGTTSGGPTLYAGGKGKGFYKQALPEDAKLRTVVAESKGEVAVDSSGSVKYLDFAQSKQTEWANRSKAGEHYKDIIKSMENVEVTSDCRGGIGEYDLEAYFEASKNASMPITCVNSGKSMVDCTLKSKGKNFKSLSQFNDHIKQSINSAGYGTRAAVVAASIALIGDYSMDTGVRLKYTWGGGHSNEHLTKDPVKDPFGLDCSGFIGWAIYHAGFKFATGTTGTYIDTLPHGKINQIKGGQPGDFLVNSHHTVMIIGTYDTGYYLAEAANTADGMRISKLEYSNPSGYYLFDMEDYYNNPKNKR